MEIVYTVDLKISNDSVQLKDILTMDTSCLNILAFSSSYLSKFNPLKYNPYLSSSSVSESNQPLFCVYICALEQPWYFHLIITSNTPFTQLSWSLTGIHLLACNQTGLCQIFQMKNGCINTMDKLYQYEIHEDILSTKYIFPREIIVINFDRKDSIFYTKEEHRSSRLQYALHSGNFLCVTSSGTIHTLPINPLFSPYTYSLAQNESLSVSHCAIHPTDQGFNIILAEHIQGALIHFFVVGYDFLEAKLIYRSSRTIGFRIPSCYGTLQSLNYFQYHGIDCILIYMKSSTSNLIDLYQYKSERKEWISINLFNSSQISITSISLASNQLLIEDDDYQGLFGRQILLALNDGSIVYCDKLNLQYREQSCPIKQGDVFIQIQHTYSGCCCVGLTENGRLILLRTMTLDRLSSFPTIVDLLVHLFEQYIVQIPCPCDHWDVLCLIPNTLIIINQLIDRLVIDFEIQSLEFKRIYFISFKECLYHLHRLADPLSQESSEHLTSLIIYQILLIVREYLRLFIYEPTNRNFVDAAQEILHQSSFMQNIDLNRVKYLGEHSFNTIQYQLISFTRLIDWITNLIYSLIGYLQSQTISRCANIFTDTNQLQWLRELIIYCYILHQMNRIPTCQIAQLNRHQDLLKDIYHSLTKFSQRIEVQVTNILQDFPVLAVETLQSKIENMFPQSYRFLLPNSTIPQRFLRDQSPLDDTSGIWEDTQFDIITLGKMSLSSNETFRRCLRCSNFARVFSTEPYPFLVYRLNNRCVCGGLFLQYTQ